MKRRLPAGIVGLAIALLATSSALPANAMSPTVDSVDAAMQNSAQYVELCLDDEVSNASACEVSGALEMGAPLTVSVSSVLADDGLTTLQKTEILSTASAGTVRTRTWAQHTTSGAYVMRQNGRFYYDGARVWVTQSYRGARGFHDCGIDFLLPGWQIHTITRSDTGSNTVRYLNCRWNVVEWPIPITRSWDMTATLRPNGTISGFWTSLG